MKPPIIVVEGKSIYIFRTTSDAQEFLEPIDIENNEYRIFDRVGELLNPKIEYTQYKSKFLWFKRSSWREAVILKNNIPPQVRSGELTQILRRYLSHHNLEDEWLSNASLDELVGKVSEIHGI